MSLEEAVAYAEAHHAGQTRKTGEPYIKHAFRVRDILKRYGLDEEILIASVLHDVTEDTQSSDNFKISEKFGNRVATMVYALSKNQKAESESSNHSSPDPAVQYDSRIGAYLVRFGKVAEEEPSVIFIKMADQIDNLATLNVFSLEKQKRKIREIEEDFLPLYERVAKSFAPVLRGKYGRMRAELAARLKKRKEFRSE